MNDAVPIERLVAAIDVDYSDGVPDEAIEAARLRRDEIIPHLIALIRRETELVRSGQQTSSTCGDFAALFLLTEFGAKEALPAIIECLSLPGDGPFDLYGDVITESMSSVLAALADVDVVDRLIADRSLNEYVRWEAAQTYLLFVRDGRLTRDAAVERLRSHLATALAGDDHEAVHGLVSELTQYSPHEAMAEIREAFDRYLHGQFGFSLPSVEQSLRNPDQHFQRSLTTCGPTGCDDALAVLHSWFDVTPSDDDATEDLADDDDWDLPDDDLGWEGAEEDDRAPASGQIIRTKRKVGRNDPCPCGSGKKHKKCCGRDG